MVFFLSFFLFINNFWSQSTKINEEINNPATNKKVTPTFELKGKILFNGRPLPGVIIKLLRHLHDFDPLNPNPSPESETYQSSKTGEYDIKIKNINYHYEESKNHAEWINQCEINFYFQKKGIKNKHILFNPLISEKVDTESFIVELPIAIESGMKYDTLLIYSRWDESTIRWSKEKHCFISTDIIPIIKMKKKFSPKFGEKVTLTNIFFEVDKSKLIPDSYDELNELADYLNKNKNTLIEISGHTDNTGTEEKNKALSTARAKTVTDYLVSKGIEQLRISYKGYGSTKPVASNENEEGKLQNRRVEFIIKKK